MWVLIGGTPCTSQIIKQDKLTFRASISSTMSDRHALLSFIPNFLQIVFNSPGYFPAWTVVITTAKIKPICIENETKSKVLEVISLFDYKL